MSSKLKAAAIAMSSLGMFILLCAAAQYYIQSHLFTVTSTHVEIYKNLCVDKFPELKKSFRHALEDGKIYKSELRQLQLECDTIKLKQMYSEVQ
jgi:hypothetical protein